MKKVILLLGLSMFAVLTACVSSSERAYQDDPEKHIYWRGTDGKFVRDSSGRCVRTIRWTVAKALEECDPDLVKKVVKTEPAPAPAPIPVVKAEPRSKIMTFPEAALFALNKAELTPAGKQALQAYREEARAELSSAVSATIVGHTDSSGTPEYNQNLSEQRAQAVRDYLVSIGADAAKMQAVGKGETQPIANNGTAEGRAKNRRVEVVVIGYEK